MKKILLIACLLAGLVSCQPANPVSGLLDRVDPGASRRIRVELADTGEGDYFELDSRGGKPLIRGNSYVNIAAGLNWYLKYYCGIHLSWNCMTAALPERLPLPAAPERHTTQLALRYDFNYCTFSYSMAFWDWERWERELDWMALHGVNLPLAAVGDECVWRNFLRRLGYSDAETAEIIPGPAYLAWFEMNNIEAWDGPLPDAWYTQQEALQHKILARMREFGMQPVLPGYSGMVPHDAPERLGLNAPDQGFWNGIRCPSILSPLDERFPEIAALYYEEQARLFGVADYYSMDPFHESGNVGGVDFSAAGQAVLAAMKQVNPEAVWVLQAWSENPREEMIDSLPAGDLLILDLFAECRPMWGMESLWQRENGFGGHDWLFCYLGNFGGKVGLHGRLDQLLENFYQTRQNPLADHLRGIGLSMEAIENNPVMFELVSELPWREERVERQTWLRDYVFARYGVRNSALEQAWQLLGASIYNCPRGNNQQGPVESAFCARPAWDAFRVYARSKTEPYYDVDAVREAASLMLEASEELRGVDNFEYDLVDVVRQAVADRGRECLYARDSAAFRRALLAQDRLLGTRREFMLGSWIAQALRAAPDEASRPLFERNARRQITTWGDRACADGGKLHDYAHKEWSGLLRDFYLARWDAFFADPDAQHDWYALEEPWVFASEQYPTEPVGDPVDVAREVYQEIFPGTLLRDLPE